jgi:hypothetical protein
VDPDPGARKLRNFSGKMHFLVIFKKFFTTKKVQNSTNYFLKKKIDEIHRYFQFDLTQILIFLKIEKKLSSKVLF